MKSLEDQANPLGKGEGLTTLPRHSATIIAQRTDRTRAVERWAINVQFRAIPK
jgi:hypothetical protein